jgi:hypothetical protein
MSRANHMRETWQTLLFYYGVHISEACKRICGEGWSICDLESYNTSWAVCNLKRLLLISRPSPPPREKLLSELVMDISDSGTFKMPLCDGAIWRWRWRFSYDQNAHIGVGESRLCRALGIAGLFRKTFERFGINQTKVPNQR